MELKEFVKATIEDIKEAVKELQDEDRTNAVINPIGVNEGATVVIVNSQNRKCRLVEIEFNVNLCETENCKDKRGIGVIFNGIELGRSKVEDINSASSTSIKFSIPILLSYKS